MKPCNICLVSIHRLAHPLAKGGRGDFLFRYIIRESYRMVLFALKRVILPS